MKIMLCLALAAAAGGKPDWVDGPSKKYPRSAYLVGVGSADDQEAARDRARGEIARIFSSLVIVETEVDESETNSSGASSFSQNVAQNVRTASRKMLEGVEVVSEWQDPASRVHFALAVLERAKGRSALEDRVRDLDKQATEWQAALDKADGKLPRVKAAMKVLALLRGREELNSELRVLDAGGKGLLSPLDAGVLKSRAAKALSELDVAVDLKGSKSDELETGVVQALNSLGLEASPGAATGDVIVQGKVETKPVEGSDPRWKFARSTITLSLKDGKSGKVFVRLDASERQAATDYQEAVRRSLSSLGKKIGPDVHEAVTRYFENQN